MTDTTPTPPAAQSGILTRAQQARGARPRPGVEGWVWSIRDEVAELLTGSPFEVDSYLQNAYRVIEASPQLRDATRQSGSTVLGAVMLGATLQLPIGGPLGQFYLTPRGEGKGEERRTVCVPMIGYRGFFELGYRSGMIRSYDYIIRREGDRWTYAGNSARGKFYEWAPYADGEYDELDEEGKVRPLTGVVALAYPLNSSEPAWQFMSRAAIDRRKPTQTARTPWEGKHAEAMYVKTPHRELAKFQQLSISSARAVEADETISVWNRATASIETLPPDAPAPAEAEPGNVSEPADSAADAENPPEADSSAAGTPPEGSGRRTASEVLPQDLPGNARAEGRNMTEDEYERYSAWEAEQEAGR